MRIGTGTASLSVLMVSMGLFLSCASPSTQITPASDHSAGAAPLARAAEDPITSGLILTSNMKYPEGWFRILDPVNRTVVFDYTVSQEPSGVCAQPGSSCTPMGVYHSTYNGEDYIDMSIYVAVSKPHFDPNGGGYDTSYSILQRVKVANPPEVVWRIESLDFRNAINGPLYCKQLPSGRGTGKYCRFNWIHSVQVVYDNPQEKKVTLVVPEGFGPELLQVTLDYRNNNTRAKVDWIIGIENPDWPWGRASSPNGVQLIQDQPGGPYLLASFYSTEGNPYGASNLAMWQWVNNNWKLSWIFPEEIEGVLANINTPHAAEFRTNPITGEKLILYAHSSGTSTDWAEGSEIDHGGTWGALRPGALLSDPPTYLVDLVAFPEDPVNKSHYTRDFDILDDGTWLLTDSSCENQAACSNPSRIFRVAPMDMPDPTGLEGYFTPDGSHMNIVAIPEENFLETTYCGLAVLFEAQWIPWEQLGNGLKQAAAQPVGSCPAE